MAVPATRNGQGKTPSVERRKRDVLKHVEQQIRSKPAANSRNDEETALADTSESLPVDAATTAHRGPVLLETQRTTLLIADDHPVVRAGIAALLNRQADLEVVGQASTGKDAVEQYFMNHPRIALLDLRMPSGDGIEAVQAICARNPDAQLIILTTYQDEEDVYRTLQAGAKGYVLKSAPVEEILACIRAVAAGGTWVPPLVGATLAKRVSTRELTPRETEVLQWMSAGKSNKEIGVALGITEATVKVHMTHILEKLAVSGRTEAIGVALKRGLIRVDINAAA